MDPRAPVSCLVWSEMFSWLLLFSSFELVFDVVGTEKRKSHPRVLRGSPASSGGGAVDPWRLGWAVPPSEQGYPACRAAPLLFRKPVSPSLLSPLLSNSDHLSSPFLGSAAPLLPSCYVGCWALGPSGCSHCPLPCGLRDHLRLPTWNTQWNFFRIPFDECF